MEKFSALPWFGNHLLTLVGAAAAWLTLGRGDDTGYTRGRCPNADDMFHRHRMPKQRSGQRTLTCFQQRLFLFYSRLRPC